MKHVFSTLIVTCFVLGSFACSSESTDGDGPLAPFAADSDTKNAPATGAAEGSGNAKEATSTTRRVGFAFVHGTGDVGDTDRLACSAVEGDFHCDVPLGSESYWTRANIDISRTDSAGVKRPFVAVGCPFGSRTPWLNNVPVKGGGATPGTADCTAAQIRKFLAGPDGLEDTKDDISDLFVVTHSGGSNVVRYMLQQHSASKDFSRVHRATRRVLTLAPPTNGTYLANWVFTRGTLGNVAQKLAAALGGDLYDGDGTFFIQTTLMDLFNKDPARFGGISKDVAGVPFHVGSGTYPHAQLASAAAKCAGYGQTLGLQFLHETYLASKDATTYRDGCSDGFITCNSAMALAQGDTSRILFGRAPNGSLIGKTLQRAHNQSKNDCDGIGAEVRDFFNNVGMGAMKGFVTSTAHRVGEASEVIAPPESRTRVMRSREWYARTDDPSARASLTHWSATQKLALYDVRLGSMRAASIEEVRGIERATVIEKQEPESNEELVAEDFADAYDVTETAVIHARFEDAGVVTTDAEITAHAFVGTREVPVQIERTSRGIAVHVRSVGDVPESIVWVRMRASLEHGATVTQRTLDVPVRFTRHDASMKSLEGGALVVEATRSGNYGVHAMWVTKAGRTPVSAQARLISGRNAIALGFDTDGANGHLEDVALVNHDDATTQHVLSTLRAAVR